MGRFDFVSVLVSGQESFADAAGRTMNYWIESSSLYISGVLSRLDTVLSADPWFLTAFMTGFGLIVFAAGLAAALRTLH
jgi:hypothetical protein